MTGKVLTIGKHKFRTTEKARTVRCPMCGREGASDQLVESIIQVVRDGKVVGNIPSIVTLCCATQYVVSE